MTWREGLDRWQAWARAGNDFSPDEARCISAFYKALARHCATGGGLDDEMPAELVERMRNYA